MLELLNDSDLSVDRSTERSCCSSLSSAGKNELIAEWKLVEVLFRNEGACGDNGLGEGGLVGELLRIGEVEGKEFERVCGDNDEGCGNVDERGVDIESECGVEPELTSGIN